MSQATPTARALGVALLPCPFCGGEARRFDIEEGKNFGLSGIECRQCFASSPLQGDRKENLVDSWNTRHPPAAERDAPGGVPEGWPDASVFLDCAMKPEEIMGAEREARIAELLCWFARYKDGKANPKWLYEHMFELCLFIVTERQRAAALTPPMNIGGGCPSEREKALREAAAALEDGLTVQGPIRGPAGIRLVREACRDRILTLLARPADGGSDA